MENSETNKQTTTQPMLRIDFIQTEYLYTAQLKKSLLL